MMASGVLAAEQSSPEVFSWLKTLPLAPEYHPTIQEFQDPIAYIFKIEKEASQYGICKIVPPVPPQSKKSVITHLNRSLAARTSKSDPKSPPLFTTRQQQIGFCPRKQRPIQKAVWQSGQHYTPQEFEAKARNFEKSYLKNRTKKTLSPLEIETLYWKANGDRPFSVEYANDMPGSAFGPVKDRKREFGEAGSGAVTVGETAWNMRGISRAYGSLLKFMKEEIAGVTSPMVYIAMLFSWFAWHVEDHDLHSLNYLHFGAAKTWYGVPRDAAVAFEEVVRIHGYGEEINPLATFAVLGEKTTVMSPEVLINAGVPCCRLVQNAGEFVVTFPRAYHSGFSHGFNCGEASNIATPEWLRFAKDAAIRRASINYPPMVSHFQLLYDLALGICSRGPMSGHAEPRSSRLRDKKKGEGETLVKQFFVQDVQQNNDLLHTLGKGTPVVLLPQNPTEKFISSTLFVGSKYKAKPRVSLGLCSEATTDEAIMLVRNEVGKQLNTFYPVKAKFSSIGQKGEFASHGNTDEARFCDSGAENEASTAHGGLSSRGLFSCVKCGIWPFACVAIVQPTDAAARQFISANGNFFNDWSASTELCTDGNITADGDGNTSEPDSTSESLRKSIADGLYDVPIQSADYQIPAAEPSTDFGRSSDCQLQKTDNAYLEVSDSKKHKGPSALGLLASVYGNSSDSDEDDIPVDNVVHASNIASKDGSWQNKCHYDDSGSPSSHQDPYSSARWGRSLSSSDYEGEDEVIVEKDGLYGVQGSAKDPAEHRMHETYDCAVEFAGDNLINNGTYSSSTPYEQSVAKFSSSIVTTENQNAHFAQGLDEDSSRMHVFCLEHAAEVEQQLRQFGGVHTLLLCHPDYPKVEAAAKQLSEEFEEHYEWKGTSFSDPTKEDEEKIQLALENEELTPKNGDWTVKLGINLYYSAILCRSPLYSKQMPYNSVIYSAFGRSAPSSSPVGLDLHVRGPGRQKKIVLAGKWCGKVWMSNQVHPLLVQRDTEDEDEERAFEIQLKANEKHGRKSESNCKAVSTLLPRKTRRERKWKVASRPTKKLKSQESEVAYSDSDDSVDVGSHQERKRSIGKMKVGSRSAKVLKLQDPESADDSDPQDSVDSESHDEYVRNARNKLFTGAFQPRGNSRRITVQYSDDEIDGGPSSRLRKRTTKAPSDSEAKPMLKKQLRTSKGRRGPMTKGPAMRFPLVKGPATKGPAVRSPAMKGPAVRSPAMKGLAPSSSSSKGGLSVRTTAMKGLAKCSDPKVDEEELEYVCDVEGCNMSFDSKQELSLHKRNICPVDGCGKKFFSHKYLVQHRRVHADERPLKCPWKGCKMTFKWAWARTEHIRVHTGARPYVCNEPGCGQTFRFVSDFSRHKRKTGHSAKKAKR